VYTKLVLALLGCLLTHHAAQAQVPLKRTPTEVESGRVHHERSRHLLIHTDFSPAEAKRLVARLEVLLHRISEYWGKPMQDVVECYVVRDLDTFPTAGMDPLGIHAIRTIGGVNVIRTATDGRRYLTKSIVYADQRPEVIQHEVVHAYCHQSFGRIGPVWYSEGMAEMGHYWLEGSTAVRADAREIEYLRASPPKTLAEVLSPHQASGDSWQNYASRWAFCHFMTNAPNYSLHFQAFGRDLLNGRETSFRQRYGRVAHELSFEYLFYLDHLSPNYCVRRTAWQWKKKFAALRTGDTVNTKVAAGYGWQPSGLTVRSRVDYEYTADGACSIAGGFANVDADGDLHGRGRLVGVLMNQYQLNDEFELGATGSFQAAANGDLYLRCRNAWNQLAADSGCFSVRLQIKRCNLRE
jgi:hypothetical protein